jgi:murein DD-endopeptidase MepM/ murein hydrolase activator NlpD
MRRARHPISLVAGLLIALGPATAACADQAGAAGAQAQQMGSQGAAAPSPEPASSRAQPASSPAGANAPASSAGEGAAAPDGPTTTTQTPSALEVQAQRSQPRSEAPAPRHAPSPGTGAQQGEPAPGTPGAPGALGVGSAPAPPPAPPGSLEAPVSGLPSFFINSFSIPPFLLPIYQAAGAAYGIPWEVLAAINEVETDYGRDLSVSSAGAEGWMQFLPSTWGQYGIDANNAGVEDPYNPADAVFAAARYLKDAGGAKDIRAAVFAYNHSQAYVESVMLRARLLTGTPSPLLGAITSLAQARFPVHAPSHFSDGFPTTEGPAPHTVPGTTIYSQADAPVIAVRDGRITGIGSSASLGRHISLTDTQGNTYTYSELGALASVYPVLGARKTFTLHRLRKGVRVIAGTVLGHLGSSGEPHLLFQIRPGGAMAQPIDPKPILDNWVKLRYSATVIAPAHDVYRSRSARGLLVLPGALRPLHVAGPARILQIHRRAARRRQAGSAHTATLFDIGLAPQQWLALVARLGQIPSPAVAIAPSTAAIPDNAVVGGTGMSGKRGG